MTEVKLTLINNIVLFLYTLAIGLLFTSTAAFAAEKEEFKSTLDSGIELQHLSLSNSNVEGVEIGFDSATAAGLTLDYRPLQNWAVKVSASTFETDVEVGGNDRFEHYGSFKQTSFSLTLLYMSQTSKKSPFKMFLGGGLSYHLNDIERDIPSTVIADFFAQNRTLSSIEDSYGIHGTLGFKYLLSDNLLVKLSLTLSASNADVEVTYPDSTVRDANLSLNAISIGTGLEYQF